MGGVRVRFPSVARRRTVKGGPKGPMFQNMFTVRFRVSVRVGVRVRGRVRVILLKGTGLGKCRAKRGVGWGSG